MTTGAQRTEQYGPIRKGDVIKIKSRTGAYTVQWIEEFEGDRPAEVTVVGGPAGRSEWRTFTVEQVRSATRPRRDQSR